MHSYHNSTESSDQQTDMFTAKEAKTNALQRVADNSWPWIDRAKNRMLVLSSRREWTGEDIRLAIEEQIGKPHHHNAWGALISSAIRDKLIIPTGKYVAMRTVKSHARKTPVYRILV